MIGMIGGFLFVLKVLATANGSCGRGRWRKFRKHKSDAHLWYLWMLCSGTRQLMCKALEHWGRKYPAGWGGVMDMQENEIGDAANLWPVKGRAGDGVACNWLQDRTWMGWPCCCGLREKIFAICEQTEVESFFQLGSFKGMYDANLGGGVCIPAWKHYSKVIAPNKFLGYSSSDFRPNPWALCSTSKSSSKLLCFRSCKALDFSSHVRYRFFTRNPRGTIPSSGTAHVTRASPYLWLFLEVYPKYRGPRLLRGPIQSEKSGLPYLPVERCRPVDGNPPDPSPKFTGPLTATNDLPFSRTAFRIIHDYITKGTIKGCDYG